MIVVIDSGCVEHFFSYRCSWSHCLVSVSNSVTVYISLTRAADIVFALGFFFQTMLPPEAYIVCGTFTSSMFNYNPLLCFRETGTS